MILAREQLINTVCDYIESRREHIHNRNIDHGSTIDFGVACYIAALMEPDADAYSFTQFDFQRHVTEREKLQTFLEYVTGPDGRVSNGAADIFRSNAGSSFIKYDCPELVKLFTFLQSMDQMNIKDIPDLYTQMDRFIFNISPNIA